MAWVEWRSAGPSVATEDAAGATSGDRRVGGESQLTLGTHLAFATVLYLGGATLFGYSRGKNGKASPPGFYHWKTGSFDLEVTDGKATCGSLGKCLGRPGNRHPWTLRIVGTPRPGSKVPCLGSDACSPLPAGDPGCVP